MHFYQWKYLFFIYVLPTNVAEHHKKINVLILINEHPTILFNNLISNLVVVIWHQGHKG